MRIFQGHNCRDAVDVFVQIQDTINSSVLFIITLVVIEAHFKFWFRQSTSAREAREGCPLHDTQVSSLISDQYALRWA